MTYYIRKVRVIHTQYEVWKGRATKYITNNNTPESVIQVGEPTTMVDEEFRELTATERVLFKNANVYKESDDDGR